MGKILTINNIQNLVGMNLWVDGSLVCVDSVSEMGKSEEYAAYMIRMRMADGYLFIDRCPNPSGWEILWHRTSARVVRTFLQHTDFQTKYTFILALRRAKWDPT